MSIDVNDLGLHLSWWSLRTEEVVCCVELLGTKASSDWVTAALALLLVRLVLHWFRVPAKVIPIPCNSNHV